MGGKTERHCTAVELSFHSSSCANANDDSAARIGAEFSGLYRDGVQEDNLSRERNVLLIVPATLGDINRISVSLVNQTVFVIESAAPISFPISFERFRFSFPLKRITRNFFDQLINLIEHLGV